MPHESMDNIILILDVASKIPRLLCETGNEGDEMTTDAGEWKEKTCCADSE
jgi:hypothetical protein